MSEPNPLENTISLMKAELARTDAQHKYLFAKTLAACKSFAEIQQLIADLQNLSIEGIKS
jgi:hypothetical protein